MNQLKRTPEPQMMYLGRWVNRKGFRAFVYGDQGKKLANSAEEFESLIASGLWLAEKPDAPLKKGKKSDGGNS